jgi:hypothetical protein
VLPVVFWFEVYLLALALRPPKHAVIAAFFVCALSGSGAIFLILELDPSFEGVLQVSGASLVQLGQ